MTDVAVAIDAESINLTHRTRGLDTYDAQGNAVFGASNLDVVIRGAIQPITGKVLQDLPEGVRHQVEYFVWSRSIVLLDDVIVYEGYEFRVMHVWPWPSDGFRRVAIGRLK